MLAQPTKDEGDVLERPSETQPIPSPTHPSDDQSEPQLDPFLRHSSSNPIPDSIPEGSGGNHGGQSSSDRSLSGNEDGLTLQSIKQLKKKAKHVISHHNAWIKSVSIKKRLARKKSLKTKLMQKESVSKQGRKPAKSELTVHKDPAFNDLDDIVDDAMDYMETEDAQDDGRTSSKTLELSLSGDTVLKVSTDKDDKGTAEIKVSTDRQVEGTTEIKDQVSDESATPTMTSIPTPTVFGDDQTIAQVLITMIQNKKADGMDKEEVSEEPESTKIKA
ncbi:hypothetical protein Tco_0056325, partial [Tanacetum coccineum]